MAKPTTGQMISLGPKRSKEVVTSLDKIDPLFRDATIDLLRYVAAGSGRNRRPLCCGTLRGGKLCPRSVDRVNDELCPDCLARKRK